MRFILGFWTWTSNDTPPTPGAGGDEIIYYVVNFWHRTEPN